MKIAHVSVGNIPVLHRFGGAVQRRIMGLATEQAARGEEVVVYSAGVDAGPVDYQGVEIRYLGCRGESRLRWIELQARAVADLRRRRVDVIHFHNQPEGAAMAVGLKAAKFLSFDYFLFHGGPKSPLYAAYRGLLKAFDGLLPVSSYCREESSAFWRIEPGRMTVLHNGVDVGQFRPDPELRRSAREELGLDGRVILYVGRVCNQKGSDLLLDAYRRLRLKRDDVRLVVAGPVGQFGRSADEPGGWPERIRAAGGLYLGAVAEERLAATYNAADVFAMPTRDFEMFGMAAVEAQACGKPVVASDHGGLKETVPLCCGGRFGVSDPVELADKLEGLLGDPEVYHRASSLALAHAATLSWRRITDRLGDIYRLRHRRAS